MAVSAIIAKRQQEALDRAAQILGVRPPVPWTKAEPGLREAYVAELILALAERVAGNESESKKPRIHSAPPFRIPD
jgi:hypothetical protein